MTRIALVGLVGIVGLTTGCDWESGGFQHDSTLYTAARGVVLHEATDAPYGEDAQVGMNGTTCAVDTAWASVGTDYDYPGSDDEVQDIGVDSDGDVTVVVTSDKGVHLQTNEGGWAQSEDFEVDGVEQARLFEDGALAIRDTANGCVVQIVGTDNPGAMHMRDGICDGPHTLATDPTAGLAWIGSDSGLWQIHTGPREVSIVSDEPSSIVAYDPNADVLYTASLGDSEVRAVEHDGAIRWAVDVGGQVTSIDDLGVELAAAVGVAYADGTGGVVVLDAYTGELRSELMLPGDPGQVRTSADGSKLALQRPDQVDFFTYGASAPQIDWLALAEAALE